MTAEYVPTDAQRSRVESASAFGITQAEIDAQLKISEPTLRKHFREELDGGKFKADMKVGGRRVQPHVIEACLNQLLSSAL